MKGKVVNCKVESFVWYQTHKDTCYCGRKATKHVEYFSGCGNVCGIHARVIRNRPAGKLRYIESAPVETE